MNFKEYLDKTCATFASLHWHIPSDRVVHFDGTLSLEEGNLLNLCLDEWMAAKNETWRVDLSGIHYKEISRGQRHGTKYKLSVPDEDLEELTETSLLERKVQFVARHFLNKNKIVFHTGAGISVAAGIPDFRGKNGVWTRRDRGLPPPKSVGLAKAQPTLTHHAIKCLYDLGLLEGLVSQNVDGLHLRSGFQPEQVQELHGNAFYEICPDCQRGYLRDYPVNRVRGPFFNPNLPDHLSQSGIPHWTGRKCDCGGLLRDSVIHFHEDLPRKPLQRANHMSKRADLNVVLGSSLHVTPAADLPFSGRGPVVIVCTNPTGRDTEALAHGGLVIHTKTDLFLRDLMLSIQSLLPDDTVQWFVAMSRKIHSNHSSTTTTTTFTTTTKNHQSKQGFFNQIGIPTQLNQLPPSLSIQSNATLDGWMVFQLRLDPSYTQNIASRDIVKRIMVETPHETITLHHQEPYMWRWKQCEQTMDFVVNVFWHGEEEGEECTSFPMRGVSLMRDHCWTCQISPRKMPEGFLNKVKEFPSMFLKSIQ